MDTLVNNILSEVPIIVQIQYLTTVLKPLTNESQHKLHVQSTENFIDHNDAIKTVHVQIPDDYKLASFDVKSLALECKLVLPSRTS